MTDNTTDRHGSDTQALLDLVARQRDLYQQLRLFSNQQHDYIVNGQTANLLTLLTRRQSLIDELRVVAEKLKPFRESWDEVRAGLSEPHRLKLRALLDETDVLMRDIMERDRADGDQLKTAHASARSRLSKVGTASRAMQAYGATGTATLPSSNRFTDKQG